MEPYLSMRVVVEVRPGSDKWYWAMWVDHEVYADGEEETREDAENKLAVAIEQWNFSP